VPMNLDRRGNNPIRDAILRSLSALRF